MEQANIEKVASSPPNFEDATIQSQAANQRRIEVLRKIQELDANYDNPKKEFKYGTAGFRDKACLLDRVFFRIGIVAALRAKQVGTCGVMITASHNKSEDNGVKIVEPNGSMLIGAWEHTAEVIVNSDNLQTSLCELTAESLKCWGQGLDMLTDEPISLQDFQNQGEQKIPPTFITDISQPQPLVYLGRDTRSSSQGLISQVKNALDVLNVSFRDFDLVTTPQLHWLTANSKLAPKWSDYIDRFSRSFINFCMMSRSTESLKNYQGQITLDCANGVGFVGIHELAKQIENLVKFDFINVQIEKTDLLNEECGAEHVQKELKFPCVYKYLNPGAKAASFDGDADRLIYFTVGGEAKNMYSRPLVVDGDKQFAFLITYIKDLLSEIGIDVPHVLVYTAYANSEATKFLQSRGVYTVMVPTGVKYAQPIVKMYCIGANDEPNGHGTIAVNWENLNECLKGHEDKLATKKLLAFLQMSNVYVGDAICNLLMCEAVLRDKDMNMAQFSSIYSENPSRMYKILVPDRSIFKTTWDESKLSQPQELQERIDKLVVGIPKGRAFVRPSGTEDVLRLYVEAETEQDMNMLAYEIQQEIKNHFCSQ